MTDLEQNVKDCDGLVNFPLELITEILSRVPFESILVCKAVCKTWYSVIKHPGFLQKFSLRQTKRLILRTEFDRKNSRSAPVLSDHLLLVDVENCKAKRIDLGDMLSGLKIMSTCDGLLCMADQKELDPVVIHNPVTGESFMLPPTSFLWAGKKSPSWQVIGLGMDLSTNKYKVVRACAFNTRYCSTKCEVITLRENSWRHVHGFGDHVVSDVAYSDGSLYWAFHFSRVVVYRFDLGEEKYHIRHPPYYPGINGMVDIGGRLAVVSYVNSDMSLWWVNGDKIGECFSFPLSKDSYARSGSNISHMYLQCIYRLNQVSCSLEKRLWCNLEEELTILIPELTKYSSELDEIAGLPGMPCSTFLFKPNLKLLPWA